MIRSLLILVLATASSTLAAEPSIQDFVKFEQAKLLTFKEAELEHKVTKKNVYVWVDFQDFDAWNQTKDLGIHVFVKEYLGAKQGVVVGGNRNNEFVRLHDFQVSPGTKEAQVAFLVDALKTPPPVQSAPAPAPVTSVFPTITYTLPYRQSCPDGKCPNQR